MSTENVTMADLLKMQEIERKDLAAGVYEVWQPIREREDKLLSPYCGVFENATGPIRSEIIEARGDFFLEWGSDGRLAALMDARHRYERERVAKKQEKIKELREAQGRKRDKDLGH